MLQPESVNNALDVPRASLLAVADDVCRPAIFMGGAHTHHGNDVRPDDVSRSWVIDCAGDMPVLYRERAARFIVRVFPDLDGEVPMLPRLRELTAELAAEIVQTAGGPERVYVMCQHGMNRSGLVAGLLLRELGVSGGEAVERIMRARPGALSNRAFRAILEGNRLDA